MTHKEQIADLEAQLAEAQRIKHTTTYVTATHTIWAADNELYIQYGEKSRLIVFDIDALFPDLPSIVRLTVKENKKNQALIKETLKDTIEELL
tara:strand:- start:838 stop:1116 length:279 start_codon:yes stop_codon:yes gene_type:complete